MVRIGILASLLLFTGCETQWSPPPHPDPRWILREAEADTAAHRNRRALAKHLWFYENALRYEPSLRGVRLSYALESWKQLATAYPPAMVALVRARDNALACFMAGRDASERFQEFAEINRVLGEESRTRDAFLAVDRTDPALARVAFDRALPALIRARDYALCMKYFQVDHALNSAIRDYERHQHDAPGGPRAEEAADFYRRQFTNRVATLVALLVVNGRAVEAGDIARRAKCERADLAFSAAVDEALRGVVPAPYP